MFEFTITAASGRARAGRLELPHGAVDTPAFMPVGTAGTVKALSPADLERVGTQMVLANTYHLHLRPGEEEVAALGGLNSFMAWPRPVLTDSGGFQVFSLAGLRTVTDEGVEFRSHIDGSARFLTPERVMEIQWQLASDVAMAFDHVIPSNADREAMTDAVIRTIGWLERCAKRHVALTAGAADTQILWPILQGGILPDLRKQSLHDTLQTADWTGVAIGGLAVGESKPAMYETVELLDPLIPDKLPRYLMGVGFPEDLLRCVARGVDLFDCVIPTRHGRHG
ncbi:MAG: tRNA guanosine(34) transglycosylase Tgt, partial [Gemmatimonadales bacterium]